MRADTPGPGDASHARASDTHYTLEQILNQLVTASENGDDGRVSVADVLDTVGARSFGPLLLVPGLIGLSPIGAIPGVPAIMAAIAALVSVQILMGRDRAWIPGALGRRSTTSERLRRAIDLMRPWARRVDYFLTPRWTFLTRGPFLYVIAAICLAVALVTPIIELVPLAGIIPNAAIATFGLALTAHDGLWMAFALIFTGVSVWMILFLF